MAITICKLWEYPISELYCGENELARLRILLPHSAGGEARREPKIILLDSRPHDMYSGKVMQHAVRAGHIPGAINIVSLDRELPKDKTVYAYCHDGFRSSLAYMQLKSLGYKDVRVYNGGWGDWGNNLTLPIAEGNDAYPGDFGL